MSGEAWRPIVGDLVAYDYDGANAEWLKEFGSGQCWSVKDRRECNHTGRVVYAEPGFVRVERITIPLKGEVWSARVDSVVPWQRPAEQGALL